MLLFPPANNTTFSLVCLVPHAEGRSKPFKVEDTQWLGAIHFPEEESRKSMWRQPLDVVKPTGESASA